MNKGIFKTLGERDNMRLFCDMLLKALKGYDIGIQLGPIDGFMIGLIYTNGLILLRMFSTDTVSYMTDNGQQQVELALIWITNNQEHLHKSLKRYIKEQNNETPTLARRATKAKTGTAV